METYSYTIATDILDHPTSIEFQHSHDYKEFLKKLLQILGMYNFMVKDHQNIWHQEDAFVKLTGPNGTLTLRINSQKRVSLLANSNQKDFQKIVLILSKFSVFQREEMQLTKSA